jgi:hypothetical protein
MREIRPYGSAPGCEGHRNTSASLTREDITRMSFMRPTATTFVYQLSDSYIFK